MIFCLWTFSINFDFKNITLKCYLNGWILWCIWCPRQVLQLPQPTFSLVSHAEWRCEHPLYALTSNEGSTQISSIDFHTICLRRYYSLTSSNCHLKTQFFTNKLTNNIGLSIDGTACQPLAKELALVKVEGKFISTESFVFMSPGLVKSSERSNFTTSSADASSTGLQRGLADCQILETRSPPLGGLHSAWILVVTWEEYSSSLFCLQAQGFGFHF